MFVERFKNKKFTQ